MWSLGLTGRAVKAGGLITAAAGPLSFTWFYKSMIAVFTFVNVEDLNGIELGVQKSVSKTTLYCQDNYEDHLRTNRRDLDTAPLDNFVWTQ